MPFESFTFFVAKSTSINCCADRTLDEPLITAAGDVYISPTSRNAVATVAVATVAVATVAVATVATVAVAAVAVAVVDAPTVAGAIDTATVAPVAGASAGTS